MSMKIKAHSTVVPMFGYRRHRLPCQRGDRQDLSGLSELKAYQYIVKSLTTGVAFRLPAEMAAGWRRFPAPNEMRDLYTLYSVLTGKYAL